MTGSGIPSGCIYYFALYRGYHCAQLPGYESSTPSESRGLASGLLRQGGELLVQAALLAVGFVFVDAAGLGGLVGHRGESLDGGGGCGLVLCGDGGADPLHLALEACEDALVLQGAPDGLAGAFGCGTG